MPSRWTPKWPRVVLARSTWCLVATRISIVQVTTVDGDILLRSGADISIDGNLQSTNGDMGLIAAGQVLQSADNLTTTATFSSMPLATYR